MSAVLNWASANIGAHEELRADTSANIGHAAACALALASTIILGRKFVRWLGQPGADRTLQPCFVAESAAWTTAYDKFAAAAALAEAPAQARQSSPDGFEASNVQSEVNHWLEGDNTRTATLAVQPDGFRCDTPASKARPTPQRRARTAEVPVQQ